MAIQLRKITITISHIIPFTENLEISLCGKFTGLVAMPSNKLNNSLHIFLQIQLRMYHFA